MLKPSDVILPAGDPDQLDLEVIESIVDRNLRNAGQSGRWPCEVGQPRTPLSAAAVTEMGMRYREHWDVEIRPHGTMLLYRISPKAGT